MWEARNNEWSRKNHFGASFKPNSTEIPPIEEFEAGSLNNMDQSSYFGDQGSVKSVESISRSLRTLPPYMGEYEAKSDIMAVPSQRMTKRGNLDTRGLIEILSTPVTCTITLAELLRIKPEMWVNVGECLKKFGIKNPAQRIKEGLDEIKKPGNTRPVPLNRVGEYCEGEDGNTTLPVEFQGVTTMAILDSGAGVAIATKEMWKTWGKPAIRSTRMKLQLADGHMERP